MRGDVTVSPAERTLRRRDHAAQRDPGPRAAARRNTRTGLLLVSPALAFVAVFALFPLVFGIYISLTNWPLIGSYHFIGLANYTALIHNPVFLESIGFTLKYTAIVTVPIFVLGYALAVFVRSNRPGSTVFRTMIFLPSLVPAVASAMLWLWLFNSKLGLINITLHKLGVGDTPGWLASPEWAMPALIPASSKRRFSCQCMCSTTLQAPLCDQC